MPSIGSIYGTYNLWQSLKALWPRNNGLPNIKQFPFGNDVVFRSQTLLEDDTVEIARVGRDNRLQLGGGLAVRPLYCPLVFRAGPNAEAIDTCFHIFNRPSSIPSGDPVGRVVAIQQIHTTAGSDAGAVTCNVTKDTGTQVPGAGSSLMTGTFNLKATANTRQTATLVDDLSILQFTGGDRLSANFTGTQSAVVGVVIVVWVQYYVAWAETSLYRHGVDGNDQAFFIANRPYTVAGASYAHRIAEATAATLTIQLTKDTGTNAPGAGTDLLTSTGFNGKAAINTVAVGTLTATAADLVMAAGDRLSADLSVAVTEHAGWCITVAFVPQPERLEVSYFRRDTDVLDEAFLIVNREYEVYDGRQIHAVAAGGISTAQLTRDRGTSAPGAGTDVLTTTWDLNATANTTQVLAPVTVKETLLIVDGDRLSIDYANTEQLLAGNLKTISLLAR